MDRTRNAAANAVYGLFLKLYQALMPFVIRTVMLRTLGMEYLGLNGLFVSLLQTLNIAELGISGAITFHMYDPIANGDTRKICALLRLYRKLYRIIGFVILILGSLMMPFLPRLISEDVPADINIYLLFAMYLLSSALSYFLFSYRGSILEAHQRNRIISKIQIISATIQFSLQILILLWLRNYDLFILTQLVLQILSQLAVYICAKQKYPHLKPEGILDTETIQTISGKIRDLATAKFGWIILNSSDSIVISMFLGLTALAVYQNYFVILTAVIGLLSAILYGSMAGIGNSIVTESRAQNYQSFKRFSFLISWIICICTNCFLVLFQPFMLLWVGEGGMLPFPMVIFFCLYFFLYEYNQLFNLYKDAAGLWHTDRFRPLLTSLVNLVLNILLVNKIGMYGIILSTVISILFVGMPWLLHNLFSSLFCTQISDYLMDLVKYIGVTLVSCAVSSFCANGLELEGIPGLAVRAVLAVCIPSAAYIMLFGKTAYFQYALSIAKRLIRKN